MADYGFMTIRLSDDWQGADFIAQHVDGVLFLRVQLKGRLTLGKTCKLRFRTAATGTSVRTMNY